MSDLAERNNDGTHRLGQALLVAQVIAFWEAFQHSIFAVYLWGQGREIGLHPWTALLGAFLGFALYRAARLLPRREALDASR